MTKWTLCVAIFLCLGIAAHDSIAKELTLDDIFPTDRVIDVKNHGLAAGLGHNPISGTRLYDSTRRIATI